MIYSSDFNFFFIHAAKTGGTNIIFSLDKYLNDKLFYLMHPEKYNDENNKKKIIELRHKVNISHLTLQQLSSFFPDLFLKLQKTEFSFVMIRDVEKRFISAFHNYCLREKKLDISSLNEEHLFKIFQKLKTKLYKQNFSKNNFWERSLYMFVNQKDYIFYNEKKIIKNVITSANKSKFITRLYSTYNIKFIESENKNKSPNIVYGLPKILRPMSGIFQQKTKNFIKEKINLLIPHKKKKFSLKFKNFFSSEEIKKFLNDFYYDDYKILEQYEEN